MPLLEVIPPRRDCVSCNTGHFRLAPARENNHEVGLTDLKSAQDIKWGLGWGLWLAGGFSIIGSALFLFQGTVLGHRQGFSFLWSILELFCGRRF